MAESLVQQLVNLKEFYDKRPDKAGKLLQPTASSVAAKISQLPSLTHDDTTKLVEAAEAVLGEYANMVDTACTDRMMDAVAVAVATSTRTQKLTHVERFLTAADWEKLDDGSMPFDVWQMTISNRMQNLGIYSPHEQTVKSAVALLMWLKRKREAEWPSLADSAEMSADFKATFPIKPHLAKCNLGMFLFPDRPHALPTHVHDRAYRDGAPVERVIPELDAIREHRVRVRKTPSLGAPAPHGNVPPMRAPQLALQDRPDDEPHRISLPDGTTLTILKQPANPQARKAWPQPRRPSALEDYEDAQRPRGSTHRGGGGSAAGRDVSHASHVAGGPPPEPPSADERTDAGRPPAAGAGEPAPAAGGVVDPSLEAEQQAFNALLQSKEEKKAKAAEDRKAKKAEQAAAKQAAKAAVTPMKAKGKGNVKGGMSGMKRPAAAAGSKLGANPCPKMAKLFAGGNFAEFTKRADVANYSSFGSFTSRAYKGALYHTGDTEIAKRAFKAAGKCWTAVHGKA